MEESGVPVRLKVWAAAGWTPANNTSTVSQWNKSRGITGGAAFGEKLDASFA
jgi:hypothetical protein